jgi:hypothetical protein
MDCDPFDCSCYGSIYQENTTYQTLFAGSLKDKNIGQLSSEFLFRIKKSISMKPCFWPLSGVVSASDRPKSEALCLAGKRFRIVNNFKDCNGFQNRVWMAWKRENRTPQAPNHQSGEA